MNSYRTIAILMVSVFLIGCEAPRDRMIVPGKRVSNIRINHLAPKEVATNGSLSDAANQLGFGLGFDDSLRVTAIDVNDRSFRTKEGLGIGSTEKELISTYGNPELVNIPLMDGDQQIGLLAKDAFHYHGIRWVIGSDKRVTKIVVTAD